MPSVRIREIDPRLAAILWIGLIYATIPFVRGLREAFAARWPAEIIGFAVMAAIAIAAAAAIASIHRSRRRIGIADTLWLLAVAAVSVIWTRHLMGQPEEAVHFIEYGILGILLYGAMERRVPDWTIYAVVVLTGMLVGTVDELIQWATPERFWTNIAVIADEIGWFVRNDINGRLVFEGFERFGIEQSFILKFGFADEESDEKPNYDD